MKQCTGKILRSILLRGVKFVFSFFRTNIYSRYIFTNFLRDLCLWIFVFFVVLFALQYVDIDNRFDLKHKLFFTFINTFDTFTGSYNVVCLVCCICFILRLKNSFNFSILKSFGMTSKQILNPMIKLMFLFVICEVFVLKPLSVKLQNFKKIAEKHYFEKESFELKSGLKFVFIDNENEKDYKIIKATYNGRDSEVIYVDNATIMMYKNGTFSEMYVAKKTYIKDGVIDLEGVNYLKKDGKSFQKNSISTVSIKTNFNNKALVHELKNSSKLNYSVLLNVYDHLKFFNKKEIKKDNTTEANFLAREFLTAEISNIFLVLLCVLLSFLFCVSLERNANDMRLAIKCFIMYFIVLRMHHQISQAVILSFWSSLWFCVVNALICSFVYLLILNKDWCKTLLRFSKKKIKNCIKLLLPQ